MTGRGHPWVRGLVCGLMTMAGGLGHTIPFLIQQFVVATTVATAVVIAELMAISYIRHRYMEASFASASIQVALGGALVFLAGLLIGSS
jgi:erythrin-vacuolar iron transport family protein